MTYGNGLPALDLYRFYWDALPTDWIKHFNIVQYLFLLLPGSLVCHAVSSYLGTNALEVQSYLMLRYGRIRKWLARSLAETAFLCFWVLFLFHSAFLLAVWLMTMKYSNPVSLYVGQKPEPLFFLIPRQMLLTASLSSVQFVISIRRNLQSGVFFFLTAFGAALLYDMVLHRPFRFFCVSPWAGNIVWALILFLAVLLWMILKAIRTPHFFCKGDS